MNILVTLNSGYIGPLSIMLKSIMINEPTEKFDLYVAHSSLTDEDFAIIDKVIDKSRTTVHRIEVDPALLEHAPVLKRISKETYYRLLVLDIIPQDVDRLLYMDPDIVVNNRFSEMYYMDFNGAVLAGAGHTIGPLEAINKKRLKMPKNSRYINAGVILFNMAQLRKICTTAEIFDYIEKNIKWLFLSDQDVINGMFCEKTTYFDTTLYNLDEKTFKVYKYFKKLKLNWVKENTAIIHYNGSHKPWKPDYKGVLGDAYFYYKALVDKELEK